jgi:hypothetical protein
VDEAQHLRNDVLEDLRLLTFDRAHGYAEQVAIDSGPPRPEQQRPVSGSA